MTDNTKNTQSNHTPTERAFVKQDNRTIIVCPECDKAKDISVKDFRHKHHQITVRCTCGHVFHLQLEFRRHFRKETDLAGTYDVFAPAVGGGKLRILNISLSGARFEVYGIHDLKPGTKGELVFTLNDRKKTVLVKNVIVRTINKNIIGCEFTEEHDYEKDLGFYLLP